MKDGVHWAWRRLGQWTFRVLPGGVLAMALLPVARSEEGFQTLYRLIRAWRRQGWDNRQSGID